MASRGPPGATVVVIVVVVAIVVVVVVVVVLLTVQPRKLQEIRWPPMAPQGQRSLWSSSWLLLLSWLLLY